MTRIKFVNAEVLRVAPDEVLIIRLPAASWGLMDDDPVSLQDQLAEELAQLGLQGRVLVLAMDDVEFSVMKRDAG